VTGAAGARPLDVLFVMRHAGFVRNYESTFRRLLVRGHRVHVAYQVFRRKHGETVLPERLAQEFSGFTYGMAPQRTLDEWGATASLLRIFVDYLRYLDSRYRHASALRQRVESYVPAPMRWAGWCAQRFGNLGVRALSACVAAIERQIPFSPEIREFMASRTCSMLLVTPLVDVGSDQVDYIREAARLGVPSALCVASWDNLTNKGVMRVVPDRVFLWNEAQKQEAVTLHGARPEQVVVTGAQLFDDWFGWKPATDREAFTARVGLRGGRPIILYLGSSFFIAPKEAEFAGRWVAALRGCGDSLLADADILVRPHPNNRVQWLGSPLSSAEGVAIWPPVDADPFSPEFKNDFFDSMWHAGVVVAINTSAEIEAAILGRPICTVRAPEFAHSQAGTLHFGHLAGDDGIVQIASDLTEHSRHLAQALREPGQFAGRTRAFVERFVRPRGMEAPAADWLAAEIEQLPDVPVTAPAARDDASLAARIGWPAAMLVLSFHPENKNPLWHQWPLKLLRPWFGAAIGLVVFLARRGLLPKVGPWAIRTRRPERGRALARRVRRVREQVTARARRIGQARRRAQKGAAGAARTVERRVRSMWRTARRAGGRLRRLVP
jgi:hypothetical protein